MKILMRILGVLLLLGGIVIAGLLLTDNEVSRAERWVNEEKAKTEKLKTEADSTLSPEAKGKYETQRKILHNTEGLLKEKTQTKLIGLIISVVVVLAGIGLFGLSFIFGKKKNI